jgi:23S rRNA (uracil1939-C5)-methyltransferase
MQLKIEKIIYGGQGLARIPESEGAAAGKRIFVPFTLPGEVIEAEMLPAPDKKSTQGFAHGRLVRVVEAAQSRREPVCPHFTHCGGCHLQHADDAAQVEIKRSVLRESLERAGVKKLPEIAALSGAPLAYRNRARVQIQHAPRFQLGYRELGSHAMAAIEQCPVLIPILQYALHALRTFGPAGEIPIAVEEIELFANHDGSALLLSLFTGERCSGDEEAFASFFTRFAAAAPALRGGGVFLRAEGRAPAAAEPWLHWGEQQLHYRAGAFDYRVSLGSFFQINQPLLPEFAALVTDGWSGGLAWDLYAGVGLFARRLAQRFSQVIAVETSASAVSDLRHNLADLPAAIAAATTENFLRHALAQRTTAPDLALLDPPRAGLGLRGATLLAQCRPRSIVYVSCDPATLSRDVKTLVESGYCLERLHMVDLFPQTYHQETVAVLQR